MNKISILMGSESDLETVNETISVLKDFKINFKLKFCRRIELLKKLLNMYRKLLKAELKFLSQQPELLMALAGVVAAHTTLPVIGIPIETKNLKGIDSFLSNVQMPPGIPVACMAIGKAGAKNAALLL